jgi:hypothetical protein
VPFIPAGPVFVPVRLAGSLLLLGLEHLLICAASEPRLCVAMGLLSRAGGRDGDAASAAFAPGSVNRRLAPSNTASTKRSAAILSIPGGRMIASLKAHWSMW